MGSAAGLGLWTFGEGSFGIAGGAGASARADTLVSRAIPATMAKVRMLTSSPGRSAQSSLFQVHKPTRAEALAEAGSGGKDCLLAADPANWHPSRVRVVRYEAQRVGPESMPRYFFHLHAGESRANPDTTGQRLPDPDAAWEAAWRIARQLLAWNLEPVPWLDYQFQVTDEAGEIVCELPFTDVGRPDPMPN